VSKSERRREAAYADAMDACLKPTILTETLGPEHPGVARSLRDLAYRYQRQADFANAELLYQRALAIQEKVLGPESANLANILEDYATLLRQTHREAEAAALEARARAIRNQQ
jgi:hypothetical protein